MALPFQWQFEILMRRNEASHGGATHWRPRYLLQMFTRDGSRWFVDERSFKLDYHSDSQMRRSRGIWNLGAAAGHLRKVTLKFCIWNQTGFVSLLTVSRCWPRRVGAGPDFIFRYSAKAALAWVQKHLSVKCLVHTYKTFIWLICRIIKTNPLDLWRFRSMNYRQIFYVHLWKLQFPVWPV